MVLGVNLTVVQGWSEGYRGVVLIALKESANDNEAVPSTNPS